MDLNTRVVCSRLMSVDFISECMVSEIKQDMAKENFECLGHRTLRSTYSVTVKIFRMYLKWLSDHNTIKILKNLFLPPKI
jgi:hypothetical protein